MEGLFFIFLFFGISWGGIIFYSGGWGEQGYFGVLEFFISTLVGLGKNRENFS